MCLLMGAFQVGADAPLPFESSPDATPGSCLARTIVDLLPLLVLRAAYPSEQLARQSLSLPYS